MYLLLQQISEKKYTITFCMKVQKLKNEFEVK